MLKKWYDSTFTKKYPSSPDRPTASIMTRASMDCFLFKKKKYLSIVKPLLKSKIPIKSLQISLHHNFFRDEGIQLDRVRMRFSMEMDPNPITFFGTYPSKNQKTR